MNFFAIIFEFFVTRRMGTEQNGTIMFIFSLSHPFPSYFCLKWSQNVICYFFGIFYYASGRNVRNDNFYFLPFSSFSNLFWHEMKPEWYFWIFCHFFGIFCYSSGRNGTIIFVFTLSQHFPPYFAWKWSHDGIFSFFEFFCYFFGIFYCGSCMKRGER